MKHARWYSPLHGQLMNYIIPKKVRHKCYKATHGAGHILVYIWLHQLCWGDLEMRLHSHAQNIVSWLP